MSSDPYERPIAAQGQRGGVGSGMSMEMMAQQQQQQQHAYFNSLSYDQEDDVDIDYPTGYVSGVVGGNGTGGLPQQYADGYSYGGRESNGRNKAGVGY